MKNWKIQTALFSLALFGVGSTLPAENAVLKGRVGSSEPVSFSVYIPPQHRDQLEKDLLALHDANSPSFHKWLTPAQVKARYGASPEQLAAIQAHLSSYGLQTTVKGGRLIQVTGSASSVEQALGTVLKHGTFSNGRTTVAAAQPITVPDVMAQTGAAVIGLTGAMHMRAQSHRQAEPVNRYSLVGDYWFDDLKQAYKYPSYKTYTGKGTTIGILMTGGFNQADMDHYFSHEKLATPMFSMIPVDGGAAYDPGNSFETHLDMQQTGGMAPDASVVLYNMPDLSDQSIVDGLVQILDDDTADVVNMSFSGPEYFYTAAANGGTDYTFIPILEDDLFAQGNLQGITFVGSSGDTGALSAFPVECFNGKPKCGTFFASAEFPASSPHVTGVGGTNLVTTHYISTDLNSKYLLEEAYADPLSADIFYGTSATGGYWGSGGGDSVIFRQPLFQKGFHTGNAKARTVPDLAGHMGGCPGGGVVIGPCNPDDSGDIVAIAGKFYGVIGTSASSPDFAGLVALTVQRFGERLGNANDYIYGLASTEADGVPLGVFNKDIPGFNGLYYTKKHGYDRVIGNGTVNGNNFLLAPNPKAVAGTPQTPSNP